MLALLKEEMVETVRAVTPLLAVACLLQITFVGASTGIFLQFLGGSLLVMLGLFLIFAGVNMGLLPMGRFIGAALSQKKSLALMLAVIFAMGFATTTAEPDVLVLSEQAETVALGKNILPGVRLVYLIAAGVGLFVAIAMLRVVWGFSMAWQLTVMYSLMLLLSLFAPSSLAPIAYDAGSVTTGVLSGPVVLALALGVTSVLGGRTAVADGFGLLGMASIGPIILLLFLGLLR